MTSATSETRKANLEHVRTTAVHRRYRGIPNRETTSAALGSAKGGGPCFQIVCPSSKNKLANFGGAIVCICLYSFAFSSFSKGKSLWKERDVCTPTQHKLQRSKQSPWLPRKHQAGCGALGGGSARPAATAPAAVHRAAPAAPPTF